VTNDLGKKLTDRRRAAADKLAAYEKARDELYETTMEAWAAGWKPATIAELAGLHTSTLRGLARAAGLPPARTGRRSKAERNV